MSEMSVAEQVEKMLSDGAPPDWIRAQFPGHGEVIENVLKAAEREAPGSVAAGSTSEDDDAA